LYELPSLRLLRVLDGHLPFVESMAFSSDGARLLSAAAGMWSAPDPRTGELRLWRDEDPIRIWDVATGQLLASFRARIEPIDSVGWHPSGRLFATLSAKDRDERGSLLQIWPAEGGEPLLRDFMPRGKSIKAARFSPDGALLAWAGDEEIEVHSILEK
jgi:WD40 repeat protein